MKIMIENLNDKLRLRWICPVSGKRKTFAIGVADSPAGRAYARSIKDRIETDAHPRNLYQYYDPTLRKYRDKAIEKNASEVTTVELFDRFTKHQPKNKALAQSSMNSRYVPVKRMLEKYLSMPAANVDRKQVEKFALVCADILASSTAKERIWLLKSDWDWGTAQYQLPGSNPWVGLVDRFKPSPKQAILPLSKPNSLIFPAPRGGVIDDQNFRPRAWKQILTGCSIEYRRPYALRHSAISHALANGANPIALSEQTGHDKRLLLYTYAHAITKEYLFVEV
jgi:integrase